MPKFYLTTPIYYVNARPHIGHAYTTIVADVLARRHRLLGDDTFFLTGTDEHGQKIERSAAAAGIPPQEFTDKVAAEFKSLWDRMGITYDKFIRTTSPEHALGVQQLWRELEARGFIYLSSYTGSYCVSDEAFVDAPAGTPCPDCGRLLETVTEENYFFKLSEFQLPLLDLIENNKLVIENESRRNEVLSFVRGNVNEAVVKGIEGGRPIGLNEIMATNAIERGFLKRSATGELYVPGALKDLSISRSSFKWGIPVPGDPKHVIYVWLDALANYITAIGYGSDTPDARAQFDKFWPADLHLVGKEIIRFHCVYWPAFLLALNPEYRSEKEAKKIVDVVNVAEGPLHLQISKKDTSELSAEQHSAWAREFLPKQITAHGWLLFDNSKMSKSKGNIVRTETILDAFGTLCPPESLEDFAIRVSEDPNQPKPKDLFAADVLRYFLLREIPFGQDGSFSFDALITRYNADLANGYGNLVSRTLSMIQKYFDGTLPETPNSIRDPLTSDLVTGAHNFGVALDSNDFHKALEIAQTLVSLTDIDLSASAPWKSGPDEELLRLHRASILYAAAEAIRIITVLLHPVMPYATSRVWAQLGLRPADLATNHQSLTTWGLLKPGTKLGPLSPIFPRADKSLIETMINMENENVKPSEPSPLDPKPSLSSATTPTPAAPDTTDSTHPAASPRTVHEPSATLPVGGSTALTTGPDPVPPPAPLTPNTQHLTPASITIDDFAKVELRVAQIVVAERIPKADKLLRLEVDLGPDFPRRQILSGIAEHYTPEDLIGRRIVVITNLAPRKMRGLESHGMLLAASAGENGKPILATFAEDIALGSRLK